MNPNSKPIYKRVLLKLSGEALMGELSFGIDPNTLTKLSKEIIELSELKIQIGIVVGGGNMFRGATTKIAGLDRITGDNLGMLATIMNALAMRDVLESLGVSSHVLSAIPMNGVVEQFNRSHAKKYLEKNQIVIFAGGTGNPLVTTDSAASLRGIEINADILLKATNVDGVYSSDPAHNPEATRYQQLTYQEALDRQLGVMDLAAFCQSRDYKLPIRVFNINVPGNLLRVVTGSEVGTLIS
jgi:uridylate kinase